jgi:Trk K+ transport system NAD-binding subunit
LRAVGAKRAILIEQEMGRRFAPEVLSPVSAELTEYASQFRVVPWSANGTTVGTSVAEFNRRHQDMNVLGYWRAGISASRKRRPTLPSPDYRIETGDTLLLIGLHDAVERFLSEA